MKIGEISKCSKSSFFSFSIRRITVQLSPRFGHVSNFHQIFTIVETFAHVFANWYSKHPRVPKQRIFHALFRRKRAPTEKFRRIERCRGGFTTVLG